MSLLASVAAAALAIDNGIGYTPPMGWRHWKAFYAHISQDIVETMMNELATQRPVDGVPTSLQELGYLYVGLDDHWQNCTSVCPNGTVVPSWQPRPASAGRAADYNYQGCRDASGALVAGSRTIPWYSDGTVASQGPYGTPQVDLVRFPDMHAMVAKAHALGLRAGWYFGNYQCAGANAQCYHGGKRGVNCSAWDFPRLVQGSVAAIAQYGFDSVKLDSGFPVASNLTLWAATLNASGRPVMIENCHQGGDAPGLAEDAANDGGCTGLTDISDCPFNFFRTTGDPEPGWETIMRELNSMRRVVLPWYGVGKRKGSVDYNAIPPRSRPGGWAYPGTATIGDGGQVVNGTLVGSMTKAENRVHFGGWCITSSPLILAFNLSEAPRRELVWEIITNKEAIQVNQAWAGHPGSQRLSGLGTNRQTEVWTKPLGGGRTAVLIVNTAVADTVGGGPTDSFDSDGRGGPLKLTECHHNKSSQIWTVTSGSDAISTLRGNVSGGCWEITGCNEAPRAEIGTGYGCKPIPPNASMCGATPCPCNGAWWLAPNGSIASVMDRGAGCVTSDGDSVRVEPCGGELAPAQTFSVASVPNSPDNSYTVRQRVSGSSGWMCVDDEATPQPPKPTPPPCVAPGGTPRRRWRPFKDFTPRWSRFGQSTTLSVAVYPPSLPIPWHSGEAHDPLGSTFLPGCTPGGPSTVSFKVSALDLDGVSGEVRVRDVWGKRDLAPTSTDGYFSASVPHHDCLFLIFMAPASKWPVPFKLAPWMDV